MPSCPGRYAPPPVQETATPSPEPAFRPGLISPTLSAQMAATFQRHSRGPLLLNVVTGVRPPTQQAYGDFLDKPQRYVRYAEFLDIVTRLWRGETVSHDGQHLHVEGARLAQLPDPSVRGPAPDARAARRLTGQPRGRAEPVGGRWFGEGVLPILRSRGLWTHPAPDSVDTTVNATPFAPTSGPAASLRAVQPPHRKEDF